MPSSSSSAGESAAPSAPRRRPTTGDLVILAPDYASHGDASSGVLLGGAAGRGSRLECAEHTCLELHGASRCPVAQLVRFVGKLLKRCLGSGCAAGPLAPGRVGLVETDDGSGEDVYVWKPWAPHGACEE